MTIRDRDDALSEKAVGVLAVGCLFLLMLSVVGATVYAGYLMEARAFTLIGNRDGPRSYFRPSACLGAEGQLVRCRANHPCRLGKNSRSPREG
jgi:hypothetical protein